MLKIGLTGGIGSGKSTVALWFKELGAYTIDADKIAHHLLAETEVKAKIIAFFKEDNICDQKGGIDRSKLGSVVFTDEVKLDFLNKLLHPLILKNIAEKLSTEEVKIAVVEMPLLYEVQLEYMFDRIIVVYASKETQINRCIQRDKNLTRENIFLRIEQQMSLQRKVELADIIINNENSFEETKKQVITIWNNLNI